MVKVAAQMQLLTFEQNQAIYKKGDRGTAFYMIVSGSVNLQQQHNKRDLAARECFAHAALLSAKHVCSTDAIAASESGCTCYALRRDALDSAFSFRLVFPLLKDMLPALFAEADEDRSGALDPEEVRALINTLGFTEVPDHYIAGIWDVFDADGDGVLDLEEVLELIDVRVCLLSLA